MKVLRCGKEVVNYRSSAILFIFATTLFAVMGVSIIAPVLPSMRIGMELDQIEVGFIITLFTIPGVFLAPVVGILADKYGRKEILAPSLILFGLTGSACALTQQFEIILLLRVFQGIGGAGLMALSGTIIGDLFEGRDRIEVLGFNASVLSVGTASYPLIGGLIADLFGTFAPFLVFFTAVLVGLLALRFLDVPRPEKSSKNLASYLHEAFRDLYNREALLALLISLCAFILLYGAFLLLLAEFLSQKFGASALAIGLVQSFSSITTAVVASRARWFAQNLSSPRIFAAAFVAYGLSIGLIPLLPRFELFLVVSFLFGIGQGLMWPTIQNQIIQQAPLERRGIVMSLLATVTRTGQSLGPVIFGLLLIPFTMSQVFIIVSTIVLLPSLLFFVRS